jgi:hypothetical protein
MKEHIAKAISSGVLYSAKPCDRKSAKLSVCNLSRLLSVANGVVLRFLLYIIQNIFYSANASVYSLGVGKNFSKAGLRLLLLFFDCSMAI